MPTAANTAPKTIKCTECGSRCPRVGPGEYECPDCCNVFDRRREAEEYDRNVRIDDRMNERR